MQLARLRMTDIVDTINNGKRTTKSRGLWLYSHNGISCITDSTSTVLITCYGGDIDRPPNGTQIKVARDVSKPGVLIGESGRVIKGIRHKSGASVGITEQDGSRPARVWVRGFEHNVKNAMRYIDDMLDGTGYLVYSDILSWTLAVRADTPMNHQKGAQPVGNQAYKKEKRKARKGKQYNTWNDGW